jgi:uncharacterized coiled-coil DUF342 family protein
MEQNGDQLTRIVVCGDSCSDPRSLMIALEAAAHSTIPGSASVLHFEAWTKPPSTLVINVDVVILCASLCHPLSFLHALDHWAPLFAHLPYVRVILAATRFELTVSPSVLAALEASGVSPVERGDVAGAAREIGLKYNDATVTYCAVSLSVPVSAWVGQHQDQQSTDSRTSRSVRDLLRACVDDEASFHEERAIEQWHRTVEDVERDMEERAVLSEWMQVSYGFFVGQHRASAEMTPVYVSRSSHGVNLTMPSQLVRRKVMEEQADYEQRYTALLENTPETYLLRKAAADADRRRAVDRSARRAVVLDPVLQMHERKGVLQREVAQLQNVRDKLIATSKENTEKRQRLSDLQEQLRASQLVIDQEAAEVAAHQQELTTNRLSVMRLEEEERLVKQLEEEIASKVHQKEIDRSIEEYRSLWATNKERRSQREETEKRLAAIAAATAELQHTMKQLCAESDMLTDRIDGHLTSMNAAQDTLLLLDGQVQRASHQVVDTMVTGTSPDDGLWLASQYLSKEIGLASVIVTLEASRRKLYQVLVLPLMALCDLEVGPLELGTIRYGLLLETEHLQEENNGYLTDVMQRERVARLSIKLAEAHRSISMLVDFYHRSTEAASTALSGLREKLRPHRLRTTV